MRVYGSTNGGGGRVSIFKEREGSVGRKERSLKELLNQGILKSHR